MYLFKHISFFTGSQVRIYLDSQGRLGTWNYEQSWKPLDSGILIHEPMNFVLYMDVNYWVPGEEENMVTYP